MAPIMSKKARANRADFHFSKYCAWSGQLIFNLFIGAFVHIIGFAPFFIALAFFDIIGAIALWMLIKVKDEEPQVQLATS